MEITGASEKKVLLFTTKTCPNCKIADFLLQKAAVPYEKVDAEENIELVNAYDIKQAPSLVVIDGNSVETYSNASNIQKYVEQLS